MSVTNKRHEYTKGLVDVERNRAAVAGEREVKAAGVRFLPPLASMCADVSSDENGYKQIRAGSALTAQGAASYGKYLSLAYFYGASGRTVDGLTGLIFSKPPTVELEAPIDYLKTNADGKGTTLRKLSEDAATEAFITPRSGFLVDHPVINERLTVAQAEQVNARPKILHYNYESIINWFYDEVNNDTRLVMVVLKENVTSREGFKVLKSTQYRVLELIDGIYHQSIYNEDGEIIQPSLLILVNGQPSPVIPFYLIETGSENKSVINDLVDANFNHYRFFADYAAKEHASAFPIFFETGASGDDTNILVGPNSKWSNLSSEANFGVLQTASDGGSMRTYLLDMESRMAALGAEMLKPRIAGAESAEAKSLDQVAQNSTVSNIATNVSEALTKAIRFCAQWLGSDQEAFIALNTDYSPSRLSGQDLTALVGSWQSGAISYDTFYANLQKGEIAGNRSAEDEMTMIETEGLGLG